MEATVSRSFQRFQSPIDGGGGSHHANAVQTYQFITLPVVGPVSRTQALAGAAAVVLLFVLLSQSGDRRGVRVID